MRHRRYESNSGEQSSSGSFKCVCVGSLLVNLVLISILVVLVAIVSMGLSDMSA